MKTWTNPRFNDRHLADRLEAEVRDLRDRLRYETGRERADTLDDIEKLEHQLSRMHC
ncbi:hypothetical protein [Neorhizobium tomejilense]|uniref:hypothetical protein n=1 Tax=Neorhizobium tomejilense TaxID=2093828 RepID=UPI003ED11D55